MTSKHNGQQLLEQLGWLSPVEGSSDNAKTIPQQHQLAELINHTNTMAVWLDTAAAPDTAQAFLAGAEGLLSGSRSPEQVMKQVRAASSGESDQ
jgi:raffinose/stachyose/melibiose transport system substrate-binding protein